MPRRPTSPLPGFPHFALVPVLLLVSAPLFAAPLPLGVEEAAAVREMSFEERVSRSELIFAGEVIAAETRWNARGNLLLTHYTFDVKRLLLGEEPAPRTLTLPFAGGVTPEEAQSVSGVPHFRLGERAVLMVERGAAPQLSPVVGLSQGVIRAGDLSQSAFAARVEELAAAISEVMAGRPPGAWTPIDEGAWNELPAASQIYAPEEELPRLRASLEPSQAPREAVRPPTLRAGFEHPVASLPIAFNPLPDDGSLASLRDLDGMAYWNRYGEIFAPTPSTGTWAWRNGRFDVAGFVHQQTMIDQFGMGWGAGVRAVTFRRRDGSGLTVEADIALNPAPGWTADPLVAYESPGTANVASVLLRELGRAWGLVPSPGELTVAGSPAPPYQAFPILHAADTAALRTAYPGRARPGRDLGIFLYAPAGPDDYRDASVQPAELTPGEVLRVSGFSLENPGTVPAAPEVEWRLGTRLFDPGLFRPGSGISLGITRHPTVPPGSALRASASLRLPRDLPAASYYLAARIRDEGGAAAANDISRLPLSLDRVPCPDDAFENRGPGGTDDRCPGPILPEGAVQSHRLCDPDWLRLPVSRGAVYEITARPLERDTDTTLEIYAGCGSPPLAGNNNLGGVSVGSRVRLLSPSDGFLHLRVGSFQEIYRDFESYELTAACAVACDAEDLLRDGFESGDTSRWGRTVATIPIPDYYPPIRLPPPSPRE